MSIEALKEQARRHEQKEEWKKALDQYTKAIDRLAAEDQPDIGLYNRVGDLHVRIGDLEAAVEHYEQAVDLYMEAFLPNNAIAVCKKIIRNVPDRHKAYLRIGQIRAEQGFLSDARTNFLTYAERMQQAGDLDESFRALVEFCDLAPEDVEVRLVVAEQMATQGRGGDAVQQFSKAYSQLTAKGDLAQANAVEAKVREIDPDAVLEAGVPAPAAAAAGGRHDEVVAEFGEIEYGSGVEEEVDDEAGVSIPDFDISGPSDEAGAEEEESAALPMMDSSEEEDAEPLPTFDFGGDEEEVEAEPLPTFDLGADEEEHEAEPLPTFDLGGDEEEVDAEPLPTFDFGADESEDEEAEPLPTFGFEEDEEEPLPTFAVDSDDAAVDLPFLDTGSAEEPEAEPLPTFAADDSEEAALDAAAFGAPDRGEREEIEYVTGEREMAEVEVDLELAAGTASDETRQEAFEDAVASRADGEDALTLPEVRARIGGAPDDVALRQRMVELAYETGDDAVIGEAFLGLAQTLDRVGESARAQAAYQQVLQLDPANEAARHALGSKTPSRPVREVAAHEDYVDLGAMILGDEEEKSTRFVVAYEEPSGDEAADFAKMLSQFKEKVSENLDADDVKAHHDLGTAYKEMGLLDEAISEFQAALRASVDHLPTYELLGQTFMEKGQTDAAIRSLERALQVDYDIEDELVGIYYYLARAYEQVGNKEQAVEYYDRVFSLDINFADVTERLRALR